MREEKQRVSISNFLYVDREKITSFYAQIFGNHPLTLEVLKAENEEQKTKIGGSIGVANGNFSSKDSIKNEFKKIAELHDAKTVDVIARLLELSNTNLFIKSGSLFVWDKVAIDIFGKTLDFVLNNPNLQEKLFQELLKNIPSSTESEFSELITELTEKPNDLKEIIKLMLELLSKSGLETVFFLKGDDGKLYGGTIRPEFLTDPVASFYFKHGANWLDGVVLIGLEEKNSQVELPIGNFMDFITHIFPVFSSFIFPEDTIKVTPIVMFTIVGELEVED